MSEEEKKAIEEFKETKFMLTLEQEENFDILLNLIDRLQKELEQEKEKNKYLENENKRIKKDLNNALNYSKEFTINKEELRKIVDECIPKKENIFTGELEYSTNANANSFLAQAILDLLKEN